MPESVFDNESVVALVRLRNSIVHTGITGGNADLWTKIVFIRELVAQIAFREISYSGPYESSINGYKVVHGQ